MLSASFVHVRGSRGSGHHHLDVGVGGCGPRDRGHPRVGHGEIVGARPLHSERINAQSRGRGSLDGSTRHPLEFGSPLLLHDLPAQLLHSLLPLPSHGRLPGDGGRPLLGGHGGGALAMADGHQIVGARLSHGRGALAVGKRGVRLWPKLCRALVIALPRCSCCVWLCRHERYVWRAGRAGRRGTVGEERGVAPVISG